MTGSKRGAHAAPFLALGSLGGKTRVSASDRPLPVAVAPFRRRCRAERLRFRPSKRVKVSGLIWNQS